MNVLNILWYKMYDVTVFICVTKINNWFLLSFTSFTLLTLSLDLVGGMGTCM